MELISPSELESFLTRIQLVDVRAPIEFADGYIPGSVNLPILNDDERAQVGTTYKQEGPDAAKALGYSLVSGPVKEERIAAWISFLKQNPDSLITCFRGGLRSQITQAWCHEAGLTRARVQGGYKALRHLLLERGELFFKSQRLLVVSGATGSGKTRSLQKLLKSPQAFALDLEELANHRGSAFGNRPGGQPNQTQFENEFVIQSWRCHGGKLQNDLFQIPMAVEDESRMIGKNVLPESFFLSLRASPVVLMEESVSQRAQNIFEDYIQDVPDGLKLKLFTDFKKSTSNISKKLGGARAQEILQMIGDCESAYLQNETLEGNQAWIEKLLLWYYDPLYSKSFQTRNPKVLFRGPPSEVMEFVSGQCLRP